MRALADVILGGKMTVGDVAYAPAVLIDSIESAPTDAAPRWH